MRKTAFRPLAAIILGALGLALVSGWLLSATSGRGAAPAPAGSTRRIKEAVLKLAGEIDQYLEVEARQDSVVIGTFLDTHKSDASGGAVIQKLLIEELRRLEIRCTDDAKLCCEGTYEFREDDSSVKVLAFVNQQRDGKRQKVFDTKVYDIFAFEDIAALLGLTVALPLDDIDERKQELAAQVDAPRVEITDSPSGASQVRISARQGSPYAIEIHVLNTATGQSQVRPAVERDGRAFVQLDEGEIYGIKVINRSGDHAAVTLSIDGLNLFEFSQVEGYRELGAVVIAPRKGVVIPGWHLNNAESAAFLVAEFVNESVARKQEQAGEEEVVRVSSGAAVGTITASFAVAVPEGEAFPDDEPSLQSVGTVQGPIVSQRYDELRMRIGRVREIVSVRYDKEP